MGRKKRGRKLRYTNKVQKVIDHLDAKNKYLSDTNQRLHLMTVRKGEVVDQLKEQCEAQQDFISEHISSRNYAHYDNFDCKQIPLEAVVLNYRHNPERAFGLRAARGEDYIKNNMAKQFAANLRDRIEFHETKHYDSPETTIHGVLYVAKKGEVKL
jgi:hypothetical protein